MVHPSSFRRLPASTAARAAAVSTRALLVLACTALALIGATPAASAADGSLLVDVPGDANGFVHSTETPVLHERHLYPGSTTSGSAAVRNTSTEDAALVLRARDLVDLENGCLAPEVHAGDSTCATEGGEFSTQAEIRIESDDAAPWSGTLGELTTTGADLGTLPAATTRSFTIVLELPGSADNTTMTDAAAFVLRFEGTAEDGTVLPPAGTGSNQVGSGSTPQTDTVLPATGSSLRIGQIELGALLLLSGLGVVAWTGGRRARVRASAPGSPAS